MIEPITPVPLFKIEISPVDWDEYDSAVIACRESYLRTSAHL